MPKIPKTRCYSIVINSIFVEDNGVYLFIASLPNLLILFYGRVTAYEEGGGVSSLTCHVRYHHGLAAQGVPE
jgi:hypothetical protein